MFFFVVFFARLKRLCYNGVMARFLLLVFPATKFEKIGSCAETAAGPRSRGGGGGACLFSGTSLETQGYTFRNSILGFAETVAPSLAVGGSESGRGGGSVFVCLP